MVDIICPHCGSKGKKTPHRKLMLTEEAKQHGWMDYTCGSCKKAFKSYV